MVNSLNFRPRPNTSEKKKAQEEFMITKNKIRKELERNITMSEYFEYFDKIEQKNMNSRQNYYLDVASQVALNSVMNHKHGAVIVYKKNIIAMGYNYCYGNVSIHAEVAAISQLKGKQKDVLPECDLYVVRIAPKKYENMLKYSKPCVNCQHYICKKNIKKAFYSTNYKYDEILSLEEETN